MVAEAEADLDVAGLVPALAGHVELHRERRLVGGVVERRAAGALQRLDLADEDAVHLPAGAIARFRGCGIDAAILTDIVGALVGEPLLGADAVEAGVALQARSVATACACRERRRIPESHGLQHVFGGVARA